MASRTICLLLLFYISDVNAQNFGNFWHISDFHLDPYYSPDAQKPLEVCPSSYGRLIEDAGPLGDYKCDSPWALIESSVYAMKRIHPSPDFILWTGDDTLHTSDQDQYLGKDKVIEIIGNVSNLISAAFPSTPVFPALGNHDYHPKSQIPPGGSEILSAIANLWKAWLSNESYVTFKQEGYYKDFLPGSSDHIIMILNSNFWYDSNKAVNGSGDPGSEFEWLEKNLQVAADSSQKVFIAGHVPPGYFEMASSEPKRWFYKNYNERFLNIIRENKDVISGMFFGHHHTDTFKIVKDTNGNVIQSMLLAPGVTPWATTLGGVVNGSNNPGIRLVQYDKNALALKDYKQYYLDLKTANKQSQQDPAGLWKKEYTATEKYGMADITTFSWGQLAASMKSGCEHDDIGCPDTFIEYHKLNSVSYNLNQCDETCQKYQLCAITEVDIEAYEYCMDNWGNTAISPKINTLTLLVVLGGWLLCT